MGASSYLDWPWFDASHRELAERAREWAHRHIEEAEPSDVDAACRKLVTDLGAGGWLKYCVPAAYGGAQPGLDVRSLCLIRETLAYRSGLADFSFALEGLGSGPLSLCGSDELRRDYLPRVAKGAAIAAFALSDAEAGSGLA